ncbi:MAG: sulfatase [Planctomycetota bacterium]
MNRRKFLKEIGFGAVALSSFQITGFGASSERPNILFIAIDDLRPELGCYGEKLVKTPNLDRLAQEGLKFTRAYCQEAICGPSRASLMTSLRPNSCGVVENVTYFRETMPDVITLPQHFIRNGYESINIGKIYHGNMRDEEKSWNKKPVYPKAYQPRPLGGYQLPENRKIVEQRRKEVKEQYGSKQFGGLACGPAYECADVPDDAYTDGRSAAAAVATLRELKGSSSSGKPFFMGLGFYKPHLPFVAPKKYWDMYNPNQISLADNPFAPKNAPSMGLHSSFELRVRHGIPKAGDIPDDMARTLIHAYLACASYVDAQIGKVLAELDRLGLRDNTIIMVWGDHGWHLGEHGIWGKATNYEIATRVPLIVSAPGMKARGKSSDALVELLDMYPTLCELADLSVPRHVEGKSFAPLLHKPDREWKETVFSQFPCPALREWAALPLSEGMRQTFFGPLIQYVEGRLKAEEPDEWSRDIYENHLMGYTVRTDRYRLVCWVDDRDREYTIATELYDHKIDPDENVNIASNQENEGLVKELMGEIRRIWE